MRVTKGSAVEDATVIGCCLYHQWGSFGGKRKCTSETELSNSISETSQDARVVMPKDTALKIVGN